MPKIIDVDRAAALRERIAQAISSGTHRPSDFESAVSNASFHRFFRGGKARVTEATADRLDKFLNGNLAAGPPPTGAGPPPPSTGKGAPVYGSRGVAYASADDSQHLAAVLQSIFDETRSWRAVATRLGLATPTAITKSVRAKQFTLALKTRVEAGLAKLEAVDALGQPEARPPPDHTHALRMRARLALSEQYAGKAPVLAKALGVTTAALLRFIKGGRISEGDAATLHEKLDLHPGVALQKSPATPLVKPRGPAQPPPLGATALQAGMRQMVSRWGREALEFILSISSDNNPEEG